MSLIIFEGIPGVGKTTLTKDIAQSFRGTRIGEIITEENHDIPTEGLVVDSQEYFFRNDERKYALARKAAPSALVVMDRSYLSTVVYNLCSNDPSRIAEALAWKEALEKSTTEPTAYIYLRMHPDLCFSRKGRQRNNSRDLWTFDENLVRTQQFYDQWLLQERGGITIAVDATPPYEVVAGQIKKLIAERYQHQ